jgi:hypothetical protein
VSGTPPFAGKKSASRLEPKAAVALLLHRENKRVRARHEATKLTPRCLVDVDHDNNGDPS